MDNLYCTQACQRSEAEWKSVLNKLLSELADHLSVDLYTCSYFIEENIKDEASYSCHLDFRGHLSKTLNIEACGVLCYTANWEESVSIGAHVLLFQNGKRLSPTDSIYLPRERNSWGKALTEADYNNEWTLYENTERWK